MRKWVLAVYQRKYCLRVKTSESVAEIAVSYEQKLLLVARSSSLTAFLKTTLSF
ncbi:hypothetical protein BC659_1450 [Sediminibacterium goheungense]|uniref:Uncharacterized protein n=1 Tax=Sediminibacterium goheungense TaxID=1086393 RepID=A0A4R6J3K6_9BACT|nr:hypothetical protein BC659_1450 [Sediminibacterium goheungense]